MRMIRIFTKYNQNKAKQSKMSGLASLIGFLSSFYIFSGYSRKKDFLWGTSSPKDQVYNYKSYDILRRRLIPSIIDNKG
jgi:hypothetical protein